MNAAIFGFDNDFAFVEISIEYSIEYMETLVVYQLLRSAYQRHCDCLWFT